MRCVNVAPVRGEVPQVGVDWWQMSVPGSLYSYLNFVIRMLICGN